MQKIVSLVQAIKDLWLIKNNEYSEICAANHYEQYCIYMYIHIYIHTYTHVYCIYIYIILYILYIYIYITNLSYMSVCLSASVSLTKSL